MKRSSEKNSSTPDNSNERKKRRKSKKEEIDPEIERIIKEMSAGELEARIRLIDEEIHVMQKQIRNLIGERNELLLGVRRNDFVKELFVQPPFVVGTVNEMWNHDERDDETITGGVIENVPPGTQCSIVRASRKQSYFPHTGLVDPQDLRPGQEVCLHPWSNVIVGTLPDTVDMKVRALEVVERPNDRFSDVGGLESEIRELLEAVELPIVEKEKFDKLGIDPPRGVLLYGPPGTGKTLLARACAAETRATFISLNATLLNQSFIGDGAKIVREMFQLAKSKVPCIIFIDEIDAIGAKRSEPLRSTEREVHSTMIELINQMDGFSKFEGVTVIAATNRAESLDPAMLRSGRFDRKIMIPEPNEAARLKVFEIHSRHMSLDATIDLEEVSKMTEGFSAVMCRAVCAEAAMASLRRNSRTINQEDMYEGVAEVSNKRKTDSGATGYA